VYIDDDDDDDNDDNNNADDDIVAPPIDDKRDGGYSSLGKVFLNEESMEEDRKKNRTNRKVSS
jgi:hypothetical protein